VWFNWVVVANLFTVYKTVICFLKKTREKEERVVGCLFVNGQSGSSFFHTNPQAGQARIYSNGRLGDLWR
jgi:hypothetical protein